MIEILRAREILTMRNGQPVLANGALVHDGKTILALDTFPSITKSYSGAIRDLGEVLLAPGLINAHTHLELSNFKGKTTPGQGFETWVKSLIALPRNPVDLPALDDAVSQMAGTGTAAVGDISNFHTRHVAETLNKHSLGYTLQYELFGHQPLPPGSDPLPGSSLDLDPEDLEQHLALAGHALYSTHPDRLRAAKAWDNKHGLPFSLHLAEHSGEVELLSTGTGSFADLLRKRVIPPDYSPPGLSPVAYAYQLGLLDGSTLAVHCVRTDTSDLELLKQRGATICLCPRSNEFIGVGAAPVESMRALSIPLCLGTDSLASNHDLNLWNEAMFLLEKLSSHITLSEVMHWMTATPARALGLSAKYGSLEPGKRPLVSCVPKDLLEMTTNLAAR